MSKKKALIAMSGGVDSSVAALLTQKAGYDIAGMTLRLCENGDNSAVKDAADIAGKLSISFTVMDLREDFETEVIRRFIDAYEQGETPNPCICCNRHIKFQKILQRALQSGYDTVVTGHYAVIDRNPDTGRHILRKSRDAKKDQSYMLYALTQEQLAHAYFPLGNLTKEEVRRIAVENGFVNADRGDSQDICFIPDGDYAGFIRSHSGKEAVPGNFTGTNGQVYGQHRGIIYYTIGQRKGLGLSFPEPMYVGKIDAERNEVLLCRHDELFSAELTAKQINFVAYEIDGPARVKVKIRYHHKEQPATVTRTDEDTLAVVFDEPQRAVTKGQAVVLYDGDMVVGGGIIS